MAFYHFKYRSKLKSFSVDSFQYSFDTDRGCRQGYPFAPTSKSPCKIETSEGVYNITFIGNSLYVWKKTINLNYDIQIPNMKAPA